MKILHYSLGFPPYRSGGLTKFCIDLIEQQVKKGNTVALMWPGRMNFINKKVSIKKTKIKLLPNIEVLSFEVINPLPIPYDEGIYDINAFIEESSIDIYFKLLKEFNPDIIHIHTLMGLHKDFLIKAKSLSIKVIFTAHDYYPICSRITMIKNNELCNDFKDCKRCYECNQTPLSSIKIKILQSLLYRKLKDFCIVKKLRRLHRNKSLDNSNITIVKHYKKQPFNNLRSYYFSMLELMDMIHYNSTLTKMIYESIFYLPQNCVINITHKDIENHKQIKKYDNKLHIRYLGPYSNAKGFYILKDACDRLYNEKVDFCLDVHFEINEEYINVNPHYSYSDLESIFENSDILVAPSIFNETFNYTILEALSFGCPVILSDRVGAKDIVEKSCGIIIKDINSAKLFEVLKDLTKEKLFEMNQNIIKHQKITTIEEMEEQILKICYMGEKND